MVSKFLYSQNGEEKIGPSRKVLFLGCGTIPARLPWIMKQNTYKMKHFVNVIYLRRDMCQKSCVLSMVSTLIKMRHLWLLKVVILMA